MKNLNNTNDTTDLESYGATYRKIQAAVWSEQMQINYKMQELREAVDNYDLFTDDPDDLNETIERLLERRAAIKAAAEELAKLF